MQSDCQKILEAARHLSMRLVLHQVQFHHMNLPILTEITILILRAFRTLQQMKHQAILNLRHLPRHKTAHPEF